MLNIFQLPVDDVADANSTADRGRPDGLGEKWEKWSHPSGCVDAIISETVTGGDTPAGMPTLGDWFSQGAFRVRIVIAGRYRCGAKVGESQTSMLTRAARLCPLLFYLR